MLLGKPGWGGPLRNFRIFRIFRNFRIIRIFRIFRISRIFRSFRSFRSFRGNHEPLHAVNQTLWQSGPSHEHDHVNLQVSDFADALQFSPYFSFKHLFSPLSGVSIPFPWQFRNPERPILRNSASRKRGIFDKSLTSQCLTSSLTSHVYRLTSPLYHHRALVPPLAKREPARGDVRHET